MQSPPGWPFPAAGARSANPATAIVISILVVGLVALLGIPVLGIGLGVDVFALVFCGFFLVVVAVILLGVMGTTTRRRIPPPPPVQQRMVPAGLQGPLELACPNCGAAPRLVDRFGVATCDYCNTRFLVR